MTRFACACVLAVALAMPAQGQTVSRAPTQTTSSANSARPPKVGTATVGQRVTTPLAPTLTVNPYNRIQNRLQTRVSNRLQNRLDRSYRPQARTGDAYATAEAEARAPTRPRR